MQKDSQPVGVGLHSSEASSQTCKNKAKPWMAADRPNRRKVFFLHKLLETWPLFCSSLSARIIIVKEGSYKAWTTLSRWENLGGAAGLTPGVQPPLRLSPVRLLQTAAPEADGLDGWLCLPMVAWQSPGYPKAPRHLAHDLWPWPCGQHRSAEVGNVGIRLPGPRPQMKESVVSIPHTHLWDPESCRTGISPNPGCSRGV